MIDFTSQLGSLASIVTLAVVLTGAAKTMLWRIPGLRVVPTWGYTAALGMGLTLIAALVFKTLEVPDGNLWRLLLNGALNGALASGLREWVRERSTSLEESRLSNIQTDIAKDRGTYLKGFAILLMAAGMATGCASLTPAAPSAESQVEVRAAASRALGAIEMAGVVVRDGQRVAQALEKDGLLPASVVSTIGVAVRAANAEVQQLITQIELATRTVTIRSIATSVAGILGRVADVFHGSGSDRLKGVGDAIRVGAALLAGVSL